MADQKQNQKRITVTPTLWGLLTEIAETRMFGDKPSTVAAFILKREVAEMVSNGLLKELVAKAKQHEKALENSADDEGEN